MTDSEPSFGPFLRRLDPLLAAEDTNALYRAFRARRLVARRAGWRARIAAVDGLKIAMATLAAMTGLLMLLWLVGTSRTWGILLLAPIVLLVGYACQTMAHGRVGSESRFPATIAEAFATRQAAIDLWMTPSTPRDVFEALYLESREGGGGRSVRSALAAVFVLVGLHICWILWTVPAEGFLAPHVVASYVALVLFSLPLAPYLYLAEAATTCVRCRTRFFVGLSRRAKAEPSGPHPIRALVKLLKSALGIAAWVVIGFFPFIALFFLFSLLIRSEPIRFATRSVEEALRLVSWQWAPSLLLATGGATMFWRSIPRDRRRLALAFETQTRYVELEYPFHFAAKIMDDREDAERWIETCFGDQRAFYARISAESTEALNQLASPQSRQSQQ